MSKWRRVQLSASERATTKTFLSRYGFAARCEATALPRRRVFIGNLGYAPGSRSCPTVLITNHKAKGRTRGIARIGSRVLRRGRAVASHRAAKPYRRRDATKNFVRKTRTSELATRRIEIKKRGTCPRCLLAYSHFPAFCNFLIFRLTSSRFNGLILSRNTIPSQ